MRIALVAHTSLYWTELYARFLTSRGHEVRVLSFSREPLADIDVDFIGRGTPNRLKAFAYLSRVPRLRSRLRAFAPDVTLATYVSSNGLAAALSGASPLVISAHGSDVLTTPGGARLHTRMMRFTCRRANIVHAVSRTIADSLIERGAPSDRIRRFPIGIDTDRFSPAARPADAGQPPSVVSTRNQAPVYDNETLILALQMLREEGLDLRASLLGGGPLLERYRADVLRLGLDDLVALPGRVPPEEVRRALQAADIYVSASRSDGASSSLLEAMACGLFPVVSDIPGNRDWIDDGETGLLFPAGNVRALAAALGRAAADETLRASARSRNRARVVTDGNIATNMAKMEEVLVRAAGGEADLP